MAGLLNLFLSWQQKLKFKYRNEIITQPLKDTKIKAFFISTSFYFIYINIKMKTIINQSFGLLIELIIGFCKQILVLSNHFIL